jgi:site-specific DNA-methyltransferase (adenine-specific)
MTTSDPTPDIQVEPGDCRAVLAAMPEGHYDAVVTDPPYELNFMGKKWDNTGVAFAPDTWKSVLRVLRPGGYMFTCGGSRTYHRLMCAVEDAGFEVRDCVMWLYGTGFPKGQGCLKPAYEPIALARKPGPKVLPLGIDGCRVPTAETDDAKRVRRVNPGGGNIDQWRTGKAGAFTGGAVGGRYPANIVHDGSDEVTEAFGEKASGVKVAGAGGRRDGDPDWRFAEGTTCYADAGTAARFFYCAKASKGERGNGNTHPTVKPLALCRWLVRLVTPPGGRVLDPFADSGTTLLAARDEGRHATGIELDAGHCDVIRKRLAQSTGGTP